MMIIDRFSAAAPAPEAKDNVADLIVRDVCEMDPANPNLNDTICIDVSDLITIVKRHAAPLDSEAIRGAALVLVETEVAKVRRHTAMVAPFGYAHIVEMPERDDGEWVRFTDLEAINTALRSQADKTH